MVVKIPQARIPVTRPNSSAGAVVLGEYSFSAGIAEKDTNPLSPYLILWGGGKRLLAAPVS
jgi:hypothetical protein